MRMPLAGPPGFAVSSRRCSSLVGVDGGRGGSSPAWLTAPAGQVRARLVGVPCCLATQGCCLASAGPGTVLPCWRSLPCAAAVSDSSGPSPWGCCDAAGPVGTAVPSADSSAPSATLGPSWPWGASLACPRRAPVLALHHRAPQCRDTGDRWACLPSAEPPLRSAEVPMPVGGGAVAG
jgi:hypothetical protein